MTKTTFSEALAIVQEEFDNAVAWYPGTEHTAEDSPREYWGLLCYFGNCLEESPDAIQAVSQCVLALGYVLGEAKRAEST